VTVYLPRAFRLIRRGFVLSFVAGASLSLLPFKLMEINSVEGVTSAVRLASFRSSDLSRR
jgi:hypothetical protein